MIVVYKKSLFNINTIENMVESQVTFQLLQYRMAKNCVFPTCYVFHYSDSNSQFYKYVDKW